MVVSMGELVLTRQAIALRGRRLEYFTIAWNSLEGIIAVAAGIIAGSVSLVGFGVDSFIEVISGAALLWRMSVDAEENGRERIEQVTLRVVGTCFLALAAYVGYEGVSNLLEKKGSGTQPSRNHHCLCFTRGHALAFACQAARGRATEKRGHGCRRQTDRILHVSVSHPARRLATECRRWPVVVRPHFSSHHGSHHCERGVGGAARRHLLPLNLKLTQYRKSGSRSDWFSECNTAVSAGETMTGVALGGSRRRSAVLSMELSSNLWWLLLAVASFTLFWRGGDDRKPALAYSLRRILSLACALLIFFPIISLTDDLHAAQGIMEDSDPAKGISKSSGAHGSAATEIDGNHLFDLVMVERTGRGPQGFSVSNCARFRHPGAN